MFVAIAGMFLGTTAMFVVVTTVLFLGLGGDLGVHHGRHRDVVRGGYRDVHEVHRDVCGSHRDVCGGRRKPSFPGRAAAVHEGKRGFRKRNRGFCWKTTNFRA